MKPHKKARFKTLVVFSFFFISIFYILSSASFHSITVPMFAVAEIYDNRLEIQSIDTPLFEILLLNYISLHIIFLIFLILISCVLAYLIIKLLNQDTNPYCYICWGKISPKEEPLITYEKKRYHRSCFEHSSYHDDRE